MSGEFHPHTPEEEQLAPKFVEPPDPQPEFSRPAPDKLRQRVAAYVGEVEQAKAEGRPAPLPIALLLVDLDGTKDINDTYGHSQGDNYIDKAKSVMESAIRLAGSPRPATAPERRQVHIYEDEIIQVLGDAEVEREHNTGDEFIILLRGVSNQEIVDEIARRIQRALKARAIDDIAPEGIEASIGGKLYEGETADELYNIADRRMYHDKIARSWADFETYPPEIQEKIIERYRIDKWLKRRGYSARRVGKSVAALAFRESLGLLAVPELED